jgi:REP element-mobilizing transposase RayT
VNKDVNKYVDEEKERRRVKRNWGFQRISRLYLALQVKSLKNSCGKYIFDPEGMDHQFFEITSPEYLRKNSALSFDIDIGKLLKDLVTVMLSQNIKQDEKMEVGILKLKIYHNMLRFLVEYHIKDVSYRNLSMIKGESFHPQIEALDAAIMFFSHSINSFSTKFGEIAQELALEEYNSKELKEGSKDFIFLADNRRKTYVPLLGVDSKRPNQIYHGKKVKYQEDQEPKDRVNDLIESWKDVGYTKYSQMILNEYLERCGSKTHFTTQSIVKWNQDLSNNFFKDILPHEKYDLPRLFDYTKQMTKDYMDSISSLQLETDFSKSK